MHESVEKCKRIQKSDKKRENRGKSKKTAEKYY